jgi:hypothetical protein
MAFNFAVDALVAVLAAYIFAWVILKATQDSREPPTIDSSIPFLSPLINLIAKGPRYFTSRR